MTARQTALVSLAAQMGLTPREAVALPVTIEVAARKISWPESKMLWEAANNAALREYLASICRTGAEAL